MDRSSSDTNAFTVGDQALPQHWNHTRTVRMNPGRLRLILLDKDIQEHIRTSLHNTAYFNVFQRSYNHRTSIILHFFAGFFLMSHGTQRCSPHFRPIFRTKMVEPSKTPIFGWLSHQFWFPLLGVSHMALGRRCCNCRPCRRWRSARPRPCRRSGYWRQRWGFSSAFQWNVCRSCWMIFNPIDKQCNINNMQYPNRFTWNINNQK